MMKKVVLIIITAILLTVILPVNCAASEENSEINKVWNSIDAETKDCLNELGIDEISLEELFNLSPTRIIEYIVKTGLTTGTDIFGEILIVIVMLVITAIIISFIKNNEAMEKIIYFVCSLSIVTVIIVPITRILNDSVSAIKTTDIFVNSYLPVMCGIIVASKNPSLAFSYNSFSVFLSSVITLISDKFLSPIISSLLAFNVLTAFSFENYRERVIKTVRRLIVVILSLFSTVYTGLLTTQSILASSSDSLVLKGVRFISGTFVPIIGGSVGDAISSVFSSFLIMKNTLGVFVIIVIILINLPVMIELLIWYFALGFCSIVSSMFNIDSITEIIDSISGIISLLNIIVFFVTFVLVISTGVIIMIGK